MGKTGAGARLTTAKFYSPLGHPISNVGITPDVDVNKVDGHLVGYRGADAPTTAPAATDKDRTLEIAIGEAKALPVAQL